MFNKSEVAVRAHSAPWNAGVEFLVSVADGERRAIAKPLTFEDVKPGVYHDPTFALPRGAAQVLMDDLWNAGLRPTEGAGSAGSLRATERHLEDMRAIVASYFEVPLK